MSQQKLIFEEGATVPDPLAPKTYWLVSSNDSIFRLADCLSENRRVYWQASFSPKVGDIVFIREGNKEIYNLHHNLVQHTRKTVFHWYLVVL